MGRHQSLEEPASRIALFPDRGFNIVHLLEQSEDPEDELEPEQILRRGSRRAIQPPPQKPNTRKINFR